MVQLMGELVRNDSNHDMKNYKDKATVGTSLPAGYTKADMKTGYYCTRPACLQAIVKQTGRSTFALCMHACRLLYTKAGRQAYFCTMPDCRLHCILKQAYNPTFALGLLVCLRIGYTEAGWQAICCPRPTCRSY